MEFGHSFKKEYFPASNNKFVPVNHGSYGLPPQCVIDKYIEAVYDDISSPDTFSRIDKKKQYIAGLQAIGELLNCLYKNLALLTNATTCVNTVLRSFPFEKGDKIALPSTTFGACYNTVIFLEKTIGIVPVVIELDYPMLDLQVIAKFEEAFQSHDIKMALYDTVSSMPSVKLPYIEITKLCKQYDVVSLVDGAHLIGLLPIDLGGAFQPDFYTLNVHKWLLVPRGCAILYVAPHFHQTVETLPISHSYTIASDYKDAHGVLPQDVSENLLVLKFSDVGSGTFAAFATIPTAIQFRKEVCGGEDKIRLYCTDLARKVGELTLQKWPGTRILENDEKSLITSMVTLAVPLKDYSVSFDPRNHLAVTELISFVSPFMIERHQTFVMFGAHNDKVIVRFSANVYNEISDYEHAIVAAQKALRAFFDGEALS